MQTAMADLHRSHLEAFLAIEYEFQRRTIALSNQRISEIKKLLATTDELYVNENDDSPLVGVLELDSTDVLTVTATPATTRNHKKKKKHKKASPPARPVKLAAGKAPRLIDAIQIVMRNKKMKAQQIHEHLRAKGWLPNSKDPIGYIRFTLSSEGDIFQRMDGERGVYHLDPSNPYYSGKQGAKLPHRRSTPETSEESQTESVEESLEVAPEETQVADSEPPHQISMEESRDIVDMFIHDELPVD